MYKPAVVVISFAALAIPALAAPYHPGGSHYFDKPVGHRHNEVTAGARAPALPKVSFSSALASSEGGGKRDLEELFTRELQAQGGEDSGAFLQLLFRGHPMIPSVIDARSTSSMFGGKREFQELLTRELQAQGDEESGAFLQFLVGAIPSLINAASSIFGGKRELEELFTRELQAQGDEESGAFLQFLVGAIPSLINAASSFFGNKREFEDVFTRELFARAEALSPEIYKRVINVHAPKLPPNPFVSKLMDRLLGPVTAHLMSNPGNHKREVEELLARESPRGFPASPYTLSPGGKNVYGNDGMFRILPVYPDPHYAGPVAPKPLPYPRPRILQGLD